MNAYDEGRFAASISGETENPYDKGTEEHEDWDEGYRMARLFGTEQYIT